MTEPLATPEEMERYYSDDYWRQLEGESLEEWQDFYSRACAEHHRPIKERNQATQKGRRRMMIKRKQEEKPIDAKIAEQQARVDKWRETLDGDVPEIEASIEAQNTRLTEETAANKLHTAAVVRLKKQLVIRTQGERETAHEMSLAKNSLETLDSKLHTARVAREKRQRILDAAERRLERLSKRRERREAEQQVRADRQAQRAAEAATPAPTPEGSPPPEVAQALLNRRAAEGLRKMLK